MDNQYYVELENNHHYIIRDGVNHKRYYCPAQDDANSLAYKLNQQNKTIADLTGQLLSQSSKKQIVFEIEREFNDRRAEHVAFVTNEELAWEFCDKHKDCYYHEIHITKYRNELEAKRCDVPTCENCKHLSTSLKGNPICRLYDGLTELDDYCNDWDYDE